MLGLKRRERREPPAILATRDWSLNFLDPFAEKRCFPKTCSSRDEGQFAVQPLVQSLDQALAVNNFSSKPRDV